NSASAPTSSPTQPAAPTSLTATTASSTQINPTWTDNSNNEDGFRIERCQGAGCANFAEIATVAANVVSYSDTGLTAATTYQYRVRAYNTGGNSAYSNTATATTSATATPPPPAPYSLTPTPTSSSQPHQQLALPSLPPRRTSDPYRALPGCRLRQLCRDRDCGRKRSQLLGYRSHGRDDLPVPRARL